MAQMDYNSAMNSERKRGRIEAYAELVKSNDLSLAKAAEKAQMTVTEFAKKAGIPLPQN